MEAHWIGQKSYLRLPRLDLEHPLDPSNYVDRPFAAGCPLVWQDDVTGRLRCAFLAFLSGNPTPDELHLVIAYIQYHIHAPCWLETWPLTSPQEYESQILELRRLSLTLKTVDDVRHYLRQAQEISLDPL